MVDLTLEALDLESKGSPKDYYVAVRVGEVQKLSKISASRAYKFSKSAIGERRFGKVDLFKRVGSASIGIKPDTDATQEVKINVDDDSWGFRVLVGGAEGEVDKSAQKNVSPKVNEAKAYLLEHNLEMRLSEAMQAVLREKPSDPAAFIAQSLAKNAGQLTRAAPAAQAPAPAADNMVQMRAKAKEALVAASADGRLDAELSNMTPVEGPAEEKPNRADELRKKAKATLMAASDNGNLDAVLADLKGPAPQAAPETNELEALRAQAKEILVGASATGKLDDILKDLQPPAQAAGETSETEALRLQAKQALLDASLDGRLQKTLQEGLVAGEAQTLDKLRDQAKTTLLEASMNGQLEATLQAAIAETTEDANAASTERPLHMMPLQQMYGPGFPTFQIAPGFIIR